MCAPMPADRTFHVIEAVVDRGGEAGTTVRRRWPDEFKERAVAAPLIPGANVSALARQMGVSPSQLWRVSTSAPARRASRFPEPRPAVWSVRSGRRAVPPGSGR